MSIGQLPPDWGVAERASGYLHTLLNLLRGIRREKSADFLEAEVAALNTQGIERVRLALDATVDEPLARRAGTYLRLLEELVGAIRKKASVHLLRRDIYLLKINYRELEQAAITLGLTAHDIEARHATTYLEILRMLKRASKEDAPAESVLKMLGRIDYRHLSRTLLALHRTTDARDNQRRGRLATRLNLESRRAKARIVRRKKGMATRERVVQRYRYHRHRLRKPETIVPALIAKDTGLAIGTVKNYLRELRRAKII